MNSLGEMYLIADELHSSADMQQRYAENEYDCGRNESTLSLSARLAAAIERRSVDDVMEE